MWGSAEEACWWLEVVWRWVAAMWGSAEEVCWWLEAGCGWVARAWQWAPAESGLAAAWELWLELE
jgi:hypothetical protein